MTDFITAVSALHANDDPTGMIELMPYARWLEMQVRATDAGLEFLLPHRQHHIGNPNVPALHGGVVAGFMELCAIFEVVWHEVPDRLPRNINFSLDYLRSAKLVDSRARCTINKLGSRVAQVQVECWQDEPDRPVALGRAHLLWDYVNSANQASNLA